MGFTLMIIANGPTGNHISESQQREWSERLTDLIPDINIHSCHSTEDAEPFIGRVDAVFGEVPPELFNNATQLRWIQSPRAAPKAGYYHSDLIESDVAVTNMRGIFSDHIGSHIMAFLLAFSRGLHHYIPQQLNCEWKSGAPTVYLPDATAVIVGVGGIGSEAARLCSAFGIKVVGVDDRTREIPPGVSELHRPDDLYDIVPLADFLVITVPETPDTKGMFGESVFRLMKPTSYLINIGRGATVVLNDLVDALRTKEISGAGLDVYEIEPLPQNHPLWTTPGALLTPHMAADGPHVEERRAQVFIDNCIRFNDGKKLINLVDKKKWY